MALTIFPEESRITKSLRALVGSPVASCHGKVRQTLVQALTGNPAFPNPTPTLAALSAAINDLEVAQTAALTRVTGAVEVRNEKRAALMTLLADLRAYVQTVANAAAPEHAAVTKAGESDWSEPTSFIVK